MHAHEADLRSRSGAAAPRWLGAEAARFQRFSGGGSSSPQTHARVQRRHGLAAGRADGKTGACAAFFRRRARPRQTQGAELGLQLNGRVSLWHQLGTLRRVAVQLPLDFDSACLSGKVTHLLIQLAHFMMQLGLGLFGAEEQPLSSVTAHRARQRRPNRPDHKAFLVRYLGIRNTWLG